MSTEIVTGAPPHATATPLERLKGRRRVANLVATAAMADLPGR